MIVLDALSGSSNPSWELSEEEVYELAKRMRQLNRTQRPFSEGGLGYRGFIVLNPNGLSGLPTQIRVYNGVLSIVRNESVENYDDVNGIENWLAKQARRHGYQDLVNDDIGSI